MPSKSGFATAPTFVRLPWHSLEVLRGAWLADAHQTSRTEAAVTNDVSVPARCDGVWSWIPRPDDISHLARQLGAPALGTLTAELFVADRGITWQSIFVITATALRASEAARGWPRVLTLRLEDG